MQKLKIDTIIFDFDSTVLKGELLEILAEIKLQDRADKDLIIEQIKKITDLGMEGTIPFHKSLKMRLKLLDLDEATFELAKTIISGLINEQYLALLPRINDKKRYIISGGYKNCINPLTSLLQISEDDIHAIELFFNGGKFSHFDHRSPLINSDGKAIVAKNIKCKGVTLMVGDGMTDYLVKELGGANYFVAYTGIVRREAVCKKADFVVNNLRDLPLYIE